MGGGGGAGRGARVLALGPDHVVPVPWAKESGGRPQGGERRGHEATDTGIAYAPVSHAHGHHHTRFSVLPCSANQISAECCLALATPCGYRMFLGCLDQLAPTTLPQRRLVSNLSHCGPVTLCLLFSLRPHKGVCRRLRLPKGVSLPLRPPHGFLSVPLSPWSLPRLTPPPPLLARVTQAKHSVCVCNHALSPVFLRTSPCRGCTPVSRSCSSDCVKPLHWSFCYPR